MRGASTPTHAREMAKKRAKTSRGARVNARPGARGRQARSRPQNIALEGLRGPLAEPLTARVRSVDCAKSGFGIPILYPSLKLSAGRLHLGGRFNVISGMPRRGLAAFATDGLFRSSFE